MTTISCIEHRNWVDIPPDVLALISSNLSFFDTVAFSNVCSSWHVATKRFRIPKTFVMLLFYTTSYSEHEDKRIRRIKSPSDTIVNNVGFYSINDGRVGDIKYHISVGDSYFVGSCSGGRLVMIKEKKHYYLLKLTPHVQRIQLPGNFFYRGGGRVTGTVSIRKSVFSVRSQDDIIGIAMIESSWLAFWRHGHDKWTVFAGHSGYIDIAFYNETLYALHIVDRFEFVKVEAWDCSAIDSCFPTMKMRIEVSWMRGFNRLVVHPRTGEIYVLARGGRNIDDKNLKWLIANVDMSGKPSRKVDSLNGEALFLGKTSCIFVSSNDVQHHGYNPNSIYFGDWFESASGTRLSNYNIENGQLQLIWESSRTVDFSWIQLSI